MVFKEGSSSLGGGSRCASFDVALFPLFISRTRSSTVLLQAASVDANLATEPSTYLYSDTIN